MGREFAGGGRASGQHELLLHIGLIATLTAYRAPKSQTLSRIAGVSGERREHDSAVPEPEDASQDNPRQPVPTSAAANKVRYSDPGHSHSRRALACCSSKRR